MSTTFLVMNRLFAIVIAVILSFALNAQELELPKISRNEIIIVHTGHTLSYNPEYMIPNWVAYELKASELEGDAQRQGSFSPDPDPNLAGYVLAEHRDYTNSGWCRGHMIPAGDVKYSQKAMDESFYTTNICPMVTSFNNGDWKRLEEKIRKWAVEYGSVYVITGPIVGTNHHGKVGTSNIVVPDAFYKAVLIPYRNSYLAIGFLMFNEPSVKHKLRDYAVSVEKLESMIDKSLFYKLPRGAAKQIKPYLPLKELGLY